MRYFPAMFEDTGGQEGADKNGGAMVIFHGTEWDTDGETHPNSPIPLIFKHLRWSQEVQFSY